LHEQAPRRLQGIDEAQEFQAARKSYNGNFPDFSSFFLAIEVVPAMQTRQIHKKTEKPF